jgi:N-acetyl-anhydromuramyl-L-alanine amidase AmpD
MTVKCIESLKAGMYRAPDIDKYLNYGERPQGYKIDTIVIHYTVANYKDSYSILTAERGVSSHYLIREDGRIDSLVDNSKKAWHAGVSNWSGKEGVNDYSIGVEIVNPGSGDQECFPIEPQITTGECERKPFAPEQINVLARLIKCLKEEYPEIHDKNIIGHSDITAYAGRKIDPGVSFPWGELASAGHGLYSRNVVEPREALYQKGDAGVGVTAMETKLKALGYNITVDGEFSINDANIVRAFNLHHNQETNLGWGVWDTVAEARINELVNHVGYYGDMQIPKHEEAAGHVDL